MRMAHEVIALNRAIPSDTLICFSHLRWNFVYQRPQHLMSRAARHQPVYFFEEPIFEENTRARLELRETPEGVTVAVPVLPVGMNGPQVTRAQRHLLDRLVASFSGQIIRWYYTPMALPFSRHLKADLTVYDNMDELSAFRGAPRRMVAMEREIFRCADVVFTGGQSLYEAKRHRHANIHAFPSSIDALHFRKARQPTSVRLPDQNDIARPRLGFFGVIDERMDLELVRQAAELRPEWQFVMLGPVVKIDPATLPQRPNIHWLGSKNYRDLPSYLSGWDIGFMPFAINESTRFISPTKTPEFLSAGLPVISTAIQDVIKPYGELGLVQIAHDATELVAIAEGLFLGKRPAWLAAVDRHLAAMSWDMTWNGMRTLMQEARRSATPARQLIETRNTAHV